MAGNKNSGRRKGVGNKSTELARRSIAMFVEDNIPNLNNWMKEIAEKEGASKAVDVLYKFTEYHLAKKKHTEHSGSLEHRINAIEVVRKEIKD